METASGTIYKAKALIYATGAKHRHLEIEGEEAYAGKGVSYCGTCDGPFFRGSGFSSSAEAIPPSPMRSTFPS